jgi:hypothetical protein
MKYLIPALFLSVLCFGNPILVYRNTHVIGSESYHQSFSFQKLAENVEVRLFEDAIGVSGKVTYGKFRDAGAYMPIYPIEVYVDFPLFSPKDKYDIRDIEGKYRKMIRADFVRIDFYKCFKDEENPLYQRFKELDVFMVRFLMKIPDGIDQFTISFDYNQDDTQESGMQFGFYMPLFEDDFDVRRLEERFKISIKDPGELLVGVSGVKKKVGIKEHLVYSPILGETMIISKKSQPVAGGDAQWH